MDLALSPLSITVFLLTIGISLYTMFYNHRLLDRLLLSPYDVYNDKRWEQLITSGFVHGDIFHLFFNMFSFYLFAFHFEMMLGSMFFGVVYFGSLIVANIPSLMKHKFDPSYHSLGASGAISGLIFSFILFYPTMPMYLMFIPFKIPAIIFGPLYIAYSYFAGRHQMDNINHDAHLWGAIAGIIITLTAYPQVIYYNFTHLF